MKSSYLLPPNFSAKGTLSTLEHSFLIMNFKYVIDIH